VDFSYDLVCVVVALVVEVSASVVVYPALLLQFVQVVLVVEVSASVVD
jgi:hypothetical protein